MYTGASDHLLKGANRRKENVNSKGCLQPLFPLSYRITLWKPGAFSSGIHLTYMHIIKKAKPTKALGQHVRGGERERRRERGKGEKKNTW